AIRLAVRREELSQTLKIHAPSRHAGRLPLRAIIPPLFGRTSLI
ncbi:MAG: hypothetical protein ACI8P0_004709, partial [Planctomycetaceae bacterium]